jgi:hypothetical protein
MFRCLRMTNADIAATINRQIEQIRWQMRAQRRVIERNLSVRTVVEAAEAELRALNTRLAVLKGNLKKLDAA